MIKINDGTLDNIEGATVMIREYNTDIKRKDRRDVASLVREIDL